MIDNERVRDRALAIARNEVGIREAGRNRGARVEQYQAAAGAHPGDPWCAAFVVWCYREACHALGLAMPLPVTAGALQMWRRSDPWTHWHVPTEGSIFVHDHGGGLGHVGFVESVPVGTGEFVTVEGNTSLAGSREGDGVFLRERHIDEHGLVGFIDVGRLPPGVS